jgi:hypothetical protein
MFSIRNRLLLSAIQCALCKANCPSEDDFINHVSEAHTKITSSRRREYPEVDTLPTMNNALLKAEVRTSSLVASRDYMLAHRLDERMKPITDAIADNSLRSVLLAYLYYPASEPTDLLLTVAANCPGSAILVTGHGLTKWTAKELNLAGATWGSRKPQDRIFNLPNTSLYTHQHLILSLADAFNSRRVRNAQSNIAATGSQATHTGAVQSSTTLKSIVKGSNPRQSQTFKLLYAEDYAAYPRGIRKPTINSILPPMPKGFLIDSFPYNVYHRSWSDSLLARDLSFRLTYF